MELKEVVEKLGLENLSQAPVESKLVKGAYCGDLLSEVMGRSAEGEIWVTIQSHLNVVAVAALKEHSAVIISSGTEIDVSVIDKARQEHIVILRSALSSYEVCGKLWELGIRRAES